MDNIPKTLNFSSIKPLGFPATVKTVHFTPQSYQSYSSMNDVIRFIINTDGYLDPYNTYIQIEIDTSDAPKDSFILQQIDGSAHSFISEFRAEANNVEIERIQEYDVLANIMYDVHYGGGDRLQRQHEGLGRPQKAGTQNLQYGTTQNQFGIMFEQKATKEVTLIPTGIGYRPFVDSKAAYNYSNNRTYLQQDLALTFANNVNNASGLSTNQIYSLCNTLTNFSYLPIPERVDIGFNLDNSDFPDFDNTQTTANQQNFATNGSKGLFVDSFCNTAFEPVFMNKNWYENSDNSHVQQKYPSGDIVNGKFGIVGTNTLKGAAKNYMTKQTFYIPLLSSIFGILMPKESFKYIPMQLFKDLILEFRMNPYAMFTSGYYNDQDDQNVTAATFSTFSANKTLSVQQKRNWKITKFEIWTDLMIFDNTMNSILDSQLSSGLLFHSQGFALGPLFQIDSTNSAQGTFQVNLGFESLRDVLVHYLSNDYIDYSFCRKNYRLSNNLSSIQLRIGNNYYPYLKIEGHGGNAYTNYNASQTGHNGQFIINLHKVFGKLHDQDQKIFINTWNFCPNERPYDVTNTNKFMSDTGALTNSDTALGMPFVYENACIGKAIYGINVEVLSNDYSRISGVNTMNQRPFEITTTVGSSTTSSAVSRDRKRTMYIWCHYDYILKIDSTGIHVLGKS